MRLFFTQTSIGAFTTKSFDICTIVRDNFPLGPPILPGMQFAKEETRMEYVDGEGSKRDHATVEPV